MRKPCKTFFVRCSAKNTFWSLLHTTPKEQENHHDSTDFSWSNGGWAGTPTYRISRKSIPIFVIVHQAYSYCPDCRCGGSAAFQYVLRCPWRCSSCFRVFDFCRYTGQQVQSQWLGAGISCYYKNAGCYYKTAGFGLLPQLFLGGTQARYLMTKRDFGRQDWWGIGEDNKTWPDQPGPYR